MNVQPGYMVAVGFLSNVTGGGGGAAGKPLSSGIGASQALSDSPGLSFDFTPIADARSKVLDQMGTSEDKLKALPPALRQKEEDKILEQIRATLNANGDDYKAGSLANVSA